MHGDDLVGRDPRGRGILAIRRPGIENAASPSISSRVRFGAASITASSRRATTSCACARLVLCAFMKAV